MSHVCDACPGMFRLGGASLFLTMLECTGFHLYLDAAVDMVMTFRTEIWKSRACKRQLPLETPCTL